MLGRNSYELQEIEAARATVRKQVADWRASGGAGGLESTFFNTAVLALDRPFVHRIRKFTGKDTNPLSEVELLVDSLMADGRLETGSVIRYQQDKSVLELAPGDRIRRTADDYERLATAFLDEVEKRSV
jgi:hypothetical protein